MKKCVRCGATEKDSIIYDTDKGLLCWNCCFVERQLDCQKKWGLKE